MEVGAKGTVTSLASLFPAEEVQRAAKHVEEAIDEKQKELDQLYHFISDNNKLVKLVQRLPDELSHDVMVPFGKAAFFPGRLIHTNEFLVLLGEGYYAERASKQTVDILQRRGKVLDSQVDSLKAVMADLKAEASFFDTTATEAAEGVVEIRENYNDELPSERMPNLAESPKPDLLDSSGETNMGITEEEEYARIMAKLDELEREEREAESVDEDDEEEDTEADTGCSISQDYFDRSLRISEDLQNKSPIKPVEDKKLDKKAGDYLPQNYVDESTVKDLKDSHGPNGGSMLRKNVSKNLNVTEKPLQHPESREKASGATPKSSVAPKSGTDMEKAPVKAVNEPSSQTRTDSFQAFTGSIVEHAHGLRSNPSRQNTKSSQTGLSGALETLCGQGYGAKLYRMLGIYLQSMVVTTFFFAVLVSFIWFFSEPILILLHQEPQVAKMAALYLRYLIPGLFAYAVLQCILRFLQTQSVILPLVICSVVPLALHVGIAYVLVYCTALGFRGAALSAAISLWISVIMLGGYVNYSEKFKHTWEGFSMECFQHVLPGMKLAVPSAVMVCLEYWAFEILVLVAGLMPNSENSTSLIAMCVNTEAVTFMFTYGFSAAVSTRVSNELGAGNALRAKNAVTVTLKLSVFIAFIIILTLIFGHNLWASAFSSSPVIIKHFASMTPLLAVSILFDSAQGVLSGVARGCGWQHLAAWTNLAAFYGIGMPIALLLAFKVHLYAKGLWIGLIVGLSCQAFALLIITLRTNWTAMELSIRNDREKKAATIV